MEDVARVLLSLSNMDRSDFSWYIERFNCADEEIHPLRVGDSTVGRDLSCTVILFGEIISRKHCLFRVCKSGAISVKDLSANGTFVNGQLIILDRFKSLKPNDVISFGRSKQVKERGKTCTNFFYKLVLTDNRSPCEECKECEEEDDCVFVDEYINDFRIEPIFREWESMVIKKEMADDLIGSNVTVEDSNCQSEERDKAGNGDEVDTENGVGNGYKENNGDEFEIINRDEVNDKDQANYSKIANCRDVVNDNDEVNDEDELNKTDKVNNDDEAENEGNELDSGDSIDEEDSGDEMVDKDWVPNASLKIKSPENGRATFTEPKLPKRRSSRRKKMQESNNLGSKGKKLLISPTDFEVHAPLSPESVCSYKSKTEWKVVDRKSISKKSSSKMGHCRAKKTSTPFETPRLTNKKRGKRNLAKHNYESSEDRHSEIKLILHKIPKTVLKTSKNKRISENDVVKESRESNDVDLGGDLLDDVSSIHSISDDDDVVADRAVVTAEKNLQNGDIPTCDLSDTDNPPQRDTVVVNNNANARFEEVLHKDLMSTVAMSKQMKGKYAKQPLTKYTSPRPLKKKGRKKKETPPSEITPQVMTRLTKFNEERKKKLQEIAAREAATKVVPRRRKSITQPVAMKVSDGRGNFLFEPIPNPPKINRPQPPPQPNKTYRNKFSPPPRVAACDNDFIQHVLRWAVVFFGSSYGKNDLTHILFNKRQCDTMRHKYIDNDDYIRTVYDMMLIDIWYSFAERFNANPMFKNHQIELVVVKNPVYVNDAIWAFHAEITSDNSSWQDELHAGHVIVIKFPKTVFTGFAQDVLGYVNKISCISDKAAPTNIRRTFEYSLEIYLSAQLFTVTMDNDLVGVKMPYTVLHSILNEVATLRAVKNIKNSLLSSSLLSPTDSKTYPWDRPLQWSQPVSKQQIFAIRQCLGALTNELSSIQLIRGPPGTGKSYFISSFAMEFFCNPKNLADKGKKLLVCALSNTVVDDLVLRLLNMKCFLPKNNEKISIIRVGQDHIMQSWSQNISSTKLARDNIGVPANSTITTSNMVLVNEMLSYHKNAMTKIQPTVQTLYFKQQRDYFEKKLQVLQKANCGNLSIQKLIDEEERKILNDANIIVTTLASLALPKLEILTGKFVACLIDEAGKATEPETLAPLALNVPHLILVGDETQIASHISSKAKEIGFSISLFTRLHRAIQLWQLHPICNLLQQYRIHPEILQWPNQTFYGGKVVADERLFRDIGWLPPFRVVYIDDEPNSNELGQCEAIMAITFAIGIKNTVLKSLPSLTMTILTAFRDHKTRIQGIMERENISGVEVEVIDSFQGQERDIVIVSLASSKGIVCTDPGKISGIVTRAKCCLIVCCNRKIIMKSFLWKSFVKYADEKMVARTIPPYCRNNFLRDSEFRLTCLDFLK